jgi:hypothetical protein
MAHERPVAVTFCPLEFGYTKLGSYISRLEDNSDPIVVLPSSNKLSVKLNKGDAYLLGLKRVRVLESFPHIAVNSPPKDTRNLSSPSYNRGVFEVVLEPLAISSQTNDLARIVCVLHREPDGNQVRTNFAYC